MESFLGRAVVAVHEFIGGSRTIGDALIEVAQATTDALGNDMAGLTLHDERGRATTAVFTDEMVPELDQAQYDADRGPCLEAFRTRSVVVVDETVADDRWPEYGSEAARHGIHSSLSMPVVVGDRCIGALNLYDRQPERFDEVAVGVAVPFVRQVAIVSAYFERAETADNLQLALESRATIDQAKGVIMATMGGTADEAFAILRQQSQNENRKLRDVAAEVVERQQRRG